MVFPRESFVGDSPAEEEFWALAKKALPADSISFHNYFLETKRPDVILLTPNRGVLIIEIKGFLAKNIKSVPDNTAIRFYNKPALGSPFNQAIEYRNKLIEMMGKSPEISPAFIAVAVCYPYISKEEFHDKMLDKISMEEVTILREDLASSDALNDKIEKIYDFVYESMGIKFGQLDFEGEQLHKVGYLFAPNFDKEIPDEKKNWELTASDYRHLDYYSKVIVFSGAADREKLTALINDWFSGAKLFLFFSNEDDYFWLLHSLRSELKDRNKAYYKSFQKSDGAFPNLLVEYISSADKDIEIVDGQQYDQYDKELVKLDAESSFNYQQYKVEHADTTDIIVKAGAGTGKTFSMISRINYIIWKHRYSPEELADKVAMITFTKDASREMKKKLENNFFDLYVLTNDVSYLEYMEAVENMKISTIHSMAKEILKKYAVEIGVGTNFTVSGSNYEKRKAIHASLNKYVSSRSDLKLDMQLYQLEKRMEAFTSQIENKNIDIVDDPDIDFGKEVTLGMRSKFADLLPVIREAKSRYREDCKKNNQIALCDLIPFLDMLSGVLNKSPGLVDYLFIDEFQDTDDVQIRLVAKYKKLFSFNLFVVGDTKQCIYRFRGADDAAFELLKDQLDSDINEIELKKNYRTDRLLLNRMNRVFSAWNNRGDIEYGEKDILIGTKTYNNTVEYHKRIFKNETERDESFVKEIRRLQTQFPGERIAVLMRTNQQILDFKRICDEHEVNIVTSVGGNLFKIDPTLDLLKLLHALKYHQRPKDVYGLYTTAYIFEKLDKAEVDRLPDASKLDYFTQHLPRTLKKWDKYIERLRYEPVLKVVRDLVDDAKPWTIYAYKTSKSPEDMKHAQEYYLRNLDQVFENVSISFNSNYLTLNTLIDYLEMKVLTRQEDDEREPFVSDEGDIVPICTTVHRAKGLEYEHVILPFCLDDVATLKTKGDVDLIYSGNKVGYSVKGEDYKEAPFENDYYKMYKKSEYEDRRKEEIRILYVAMTRAIKSLIYFVDDQRERRKTATNWKGMLLDEE